MTRRRRANQIAVAWALCATGLLALASGAQEATLAETPLAAPPEVAELHGDATPDPATADQTPTGDGVVASATSGPAEPGWNSLLEDVWQAERTNLDDRVLETRRASFELGAWNLDPAARVLIAGEIDGSELDRAQAAVELAPHLPAAHMRLAKAIWLSGDSPMAAVRSLVAAVQAIAGHLEASFWFGGSALYFLAFALVVGGLLAIGLVGIAALPHASHDLGHFFSSHMPGFACAAALASILLLPLALGEGLLGLALAFAGIAVIYGKRAHRVAVFLAVVGIGLGAYPVIRAAGAALAALPEDPVARAAFSVGQGLATPVDRARLEAAVDADLMAMRGLAVLARRAGNLGEADKLYQELLAAGANDVGALNNAANVRLELGHMESALELYGRASELGQSPVVLFNLAQAYGRAFQVEDLNRTIAEAQRVGGDLVARLTALQGTDTEGFVVDYPLTHDLFWSRAMRPGAGETVASEFRERFAPGALGREWTLFAGVALVVILAGTLFGARIHPARWCPRCGGRMCPRCNSSRGEMCSGCHRLFHQPEKTDRVLRLERVNALRNRERRMDRLSTLVSVVVPGAAGLLAEKPLRTWLGALFFTLAAAALVWREGIVPDPFVAGSAATLVFVGLAAIATVLYGLVVATLAGQSEARLVSVGLSGNLVDFGIADVFQLIGQQRKTGVLELKSETTRAQLVFDEGMVVSAAPASGRAGELDPLADRLIRCGLLTRDRAEEAVQACRASAQTLASTLREREWLPDDQIESAEELVTRDTIFEVLRWRTGTFDFRAQEVSHTRDRSQLLGAEQILMDGLRMVDEWQSFADLVPSEETVFQRSGRFERYLEKAGRDDPEARARAERVFQRVDGRLSARRVIDLAQLGTFDGMRSLAELREADAIRPLHPESVRHVRRVARSTTPTGRPSAVGRAIAAAIPLAILAGVVWWTAAESMAAPEPTPGGPVARATLAELEDAYATRAARHAIEAYRFHHGDWPESLADVEATGLLERAALAAPRGRPYYSQQQAEGWVFLGPDR